MTEPRITRPRSVSETAHWVAAYRAIESSRPDALFHDPFAVRLAGDLGRDLPKSVPPWPMIARTKLIDDLIARAVVDGVDCVLNLAAGLDTRPYRLALPSTLQWVEADLPSVIEEKERVLANERPSCVLRREKVDLADAAARDSFLADATAGATKALVITEGLLLYLEDATVRTLGRALLAQRAVCTWVADLASPGTLRRLQRQTDARLDETERMRFARADGVAFFEAMGWTPSEIHSLLAEAARTKRASLLFRLLALLPEPNPRRLGARPWGAVVRFERAAAALSTSPITNEKKEVTL